MNFLIADTFTDSLARLAGDEQKAVKMTAFDLQMNLASPGLSFHKLDKAKDKNFWSVRVSADRRLIVHKTPDSLLLCYVAHHDKAYDWAERRKLEIHPRTGAAQIVQIREVVREIMVPSYTGGDAIFPRTSYFVPPNEPLKLFSGVPEDDLLNFGVPPEWIADVKGLESESGLLKIFDILPSEAAEALLELATGGKPRMPQPVEPSVNPFEHPDAQRRFRVMTNVEELQQALDNPWEKWTVFLHPEQRQWVEREYSGPARISGSAGTGKTIVALHRAAYLARTHPEARVLLATFSDTLAHALHTKLKRLIGCEPRLAERIDVHSLEALGVRLYKAHFGAVNLAGRHDVKACVRNASESVAGHRFSLQFLLAEWEHVVDAWQLTTWDAYREVARLGRKTRLPEAQRLVLWSIFEGVISRLQERGLKTPSAVFAALAGALAGGKNLPFEFAVADEAQDLSVSQLRFFAALGGNRPNALFFAGDIGQRIFQQPFSWKSLGVDIRGRSRNLRINYRTSHQIRQQADRLLGPEVTDVDGNREDRSDTISVFNGPPPVIVVFADEGEEAKGVAAWLLEQSTAGVLPHEFGVFVRSDGQLDRARAAVEGAGLPFKVLDEHVETANGHVSICTMHLAKGLEFRAVVVMACDDEIIPLQERIETVGDDADLQEVYDTERHLLYVACTRARDHLLVTSVGPASEFLDDLMV
ncbi:MAG: UvrD-helicase domain-containing protein [Verrucomicrobia bacterium]|nr:UvrD-helicase domain-containing protein [Verrucomicrobiota bacterium]